MNFLNPEELIHRLEPDDKRLLVILLDKRSDINEAKPVIEAQANLFHKKLEIVLIDIEYQNMVIEKFNVHGCPACIFLQDGKKKDVLLGRHFLKILNEFIINNLSDQEGKKRLDC